MAGQIAPTAAMIAATRSGPATPPTWSMRLVHAEAASQSGGGGVGQQRGLAGLRTAFPTRSPSIRTQASNPAPATNGVIARAGTQIAVRA